MLGYDAAGTVQGRYLGRVKERLKRVRCGALLETAQSWRPGPRAVSLSTTPPRNIPGALLDFRLLLVKRVYCVVAFQGALGAVLEAWLLPKEDKLGGAPSIKFTFTGHAPLSKSKMQTALTDLTA